MFRIAVDEMARNAESLNYSLVLSAEARGFVFGTALAYRSGKGLILARKPNRLPRDTISATYDLEYSSNTLEIHADSISPGSRVLVVDDLLATGGTAGAMCQLVERSGGSVSGIAVLIELEFLKGRQNLAPYQVVSVLSYGD